jgi:UDPglucose--hexose-1-phosphate uridylyltransferase
MERGAQETPSATTLPEYEPKCYLCPGNERANGDHNPSYSSTFAFTNDFSAVREDQEPYHPNSADSSPLTRLLKVEPAEGKCYVLCFHPSHNLTLADMSPKQIGPIIEKWTEIYSSHLSATSPLKSQGASQANGSQETKQLKYMQIFENKGSAMGCSNPHPHGQIWTTTFIPEEPSLELRNLSKYNTDHNGKHMLVEYAALELEQSERVIYSNPSFLALCPWWATWPFEVMIIARSHKRALTDFNDSERSDLADVMSHVTRKYDNLFQTHFPYSMGIHQAPLDCTDAEVEASHFHMHFYPPLLRSTSVKKFMVGYVSSFSSSFIWLFRDGVSFFDCVDETNNKTGSS